MQTFAIIQLTIEVVNRWQNWKKMNSLVCASCLDRIFVTCFTEHCPWNLSRITIENVGEEVLKSKFLMLNNPKMEVEIQW